MNIALSGASGFVGKNLVNYLESFNEFDTFSLNLREGLTNDLNNYEFILHLAGKAHDVNNIADSEEYDRINFGLTKELFDLFLQSEAHTFVFFSSVKAVADNLEGVLSEDHLASPLTPYGKSKLKAERYLLDNIVGSNKRVIILRPCMIHGPGNKGNLNLLYKFVSRGLPYPLGLYDNKRSYLSIENLNFIIESILKSSNFKGGIYNVSDDDALSTVEVIKLISNQLRRKPRILNLSTKMINYFAKFGDKFNFPLNSQRLKKLTESYIVDNTKIKLELGIDKMKISVIDGLNKTIECFKVK